MSPGASHLTEEHIASTLSNIPEIPTASVPHAADPKVKFEAKGKTIVIFL